MLKKIDGGFKCILMIKPVAKGRPRVGRHGVYTPEKTRTAEFDLKALMRALKQPMSVRPLKVTMVFQFGSKKKGRPEWKPTRVDIDNICKLAMDSGNGILWRDDSQIVDLRAQKIFGNIDCIFLEVVELEYHPVPIEAIY